MKSLDDTFDTKFVDVFERRGQSMDWLRGKLFQLDGGKDFYPSHQADPAEAIKILFYQLLQFSRNDLLDHHIQQHEEVSCRNCNVSFTRQIENHLGDSFLRLNVPRNETVTSIQDLISNYTSQTLKRVQCNHCKKTSFAKTKNEILQVGKVLIMKLNWYDNNDQLILDQEVRPTERLSIGGKTFELKATNHHQVNKHTVTYNDCFTDFRE